jgi:hypothetical protein
MAQPYRQRPFWELCLEYKAEEVDVKLLLQPMADPRYETEQPISTQR